MNSLSGILEKFDGLRVLIVGDIMVDEHIWGTANRVSPEAPVLVVDANGDPEVLPGGAANVTNNIRTLGGSASVIGVIGNDVYGKMLMDKLTSAGVDTTGLVIDPARVTTRKTRIWVSHRQQVVRVDHENREPMNESVANQVLSKIREKLADCDVLILSDYNKGVLAPSVAAQIVDMATGMGKICTANPKPVNLRGFNGAGLITLNQSEAETASGTAFCCEDDVMKAGRSMLTDLNLGSLVITRGSVGLTVFDTNAVETVAAVPMEVYDVAGAGDTVISSISMALAAGASTFDAARIGNLAGGAAVRKVGVAAITRSEILALAEGRIGS